MASRTWGRAGARATAVVAVIALAGCAHAEPCRGGASCAGAQVCGLAGACVAPPAMDDIRFVEVHELEAEADAEGPARQPLVLGGGAEPVELVFGPLPRGRLVSALLRLAPCPSSSRQAEGVVAVGRGRRRADVRYAIGRDAPLYVDVSALLDGAEAGDMVTFAISMRARGDAVFEAASARSPDAASRPRLFLVLR